jgi:hypothetical protein
MSNAAIPGSAPANSSLVSSLWVRHGIAAGKPLQSGPETRNRDVRSGRAGKAQRPLSFFFSGRQCEVTGCRKTAWPVVATLVLSLAAL